MTPEQRLIAIKTFVTDPRRMEAWDSWRVYIAAGGGASWPRDAFESMLDWIAGQCEGDTKQGPNS